MAAGKHMHTFDTKEEGATPWIRSAQVLITWGVRPRCGTWIQLEAIQIFTMEGSLSFSGRQIAITVSSTSTRVGKIC